MPPKPRLHKEKGKMKSIPKVEQTPLNEPQPSTSEQENQVQFEVELLWCIQQLQSALSSGKLNSKQTQDSTKTLNLLMSHSTPIIRKRQLMRLSFGDYRAKMLEEQTRYLKKNEKITYVSCKPSKKSVFVKKAPFLSTGKDFKFNFETPKDQLDTIEKAIENMEIKEESDKKNTNYQFEPSSNAFRFNFSVDMD